MNYYPLIWIFLPPCAVLAALTWRDDRKELKRVREELWTCQATLMRAAQGILTERYYNTGGGKVTFAQAEKAMRSYCRYTPPEVVLEMAFGRHKQ